MTKKEYLSQAFWFDKLIKIKIEQLASFRDEAEKCTPTLTGMPGSTDRGASKVANCVASMVDLEHEMKVELDELLQARRGILLAIKVLGDPESRLLLELRYIHYKTWKEISQVMEYNIRHVYRLHDEALEKLKILLI